MVPLNLEKRTPEARFTLMKDHIKLINTLTEGKTLSQLTQAEISILNQSLRVIAEAHNKLRANGKLTN